MLTENIVKGIIINVLFISLIILFCILLVKLYIKKTKEHNQKELAFQKTLTQTILETQEQVLNNLAQELHDDAGQQLTAINFQIENLKLDQPQWQPQLQPIGESVQQVAQTIRSLSHSMTHQLLLQNTLSDVMEKEIKRLNRNSRVALVFQYDKQEIGLPENEKIILYRIFQECLNNALKHAQANQILVRWLASDPKTLLITDDGVGFEPDWNSNHSMGLTTMQQRAMLIGYELTIISHLGKGTEIIIIDKKSDYGKN